MRRRYLCLSCLHPLPAQRMSVIDDFITHFELIGRALRSSRPATQSLTCCGDLVEWPVFWFLMV